MHAWLDENCADAWAMTPPGLRGVVNEAVAIYFLDATSAAAFVSRWCDGSKVEINEGAFRVRDKQPVPRTSPGRTRRSDERGLPAKRARASMRRTGIDATR